MQAEYGENFCCKNLLRYNMFSKDIPTDTSVNTHIFATANDRRGYCKVSMLFRTTYVN